MDSNLLTLVLGAVRGEVTRARQKFPPFRSPHEGYALLLEEVDELWEVVREQYDNPGRKERMRKEAMQVAAMAVCFMVECCDE